MIFILFCSGVQIKCCNNLQYKVVITDTIWFMRMNKYTYKLHPPPYCITHRIPHDDVYVWAERVVNVLWDVKVDKVAEMVVHVHPCLGKKDH